MVGDMSGAFRRGSDNGNGAAWELDGAICSNAALSGSVSSGEDKAEGHPPPVRADVVEEFGGGPDGPGLSSGSNQDQKRGLESEGTSDDCTAAWLPDGRR